MGDGGKGGKWRSTPKKRGDGKHVFEDHRSGWRYSRFPRYGKAAYLVVARREWIGVKHTQIFRALLGLAALRRPRYLVIDATGVGDGLWCLLENVFPGRGCRSSLRRRSRAIWAMDSSELLIRADWFREYHPFHEPFITQLNKCRSEIVPGPLHLMRWGVLDGTLNQSTGELVHNDDILASSLCHILDKQDWWMRLPSVYMPGRDPLDG